MLEKNCSGPKRSYSRIERNTSLRVTRSHFTIGFSRISKMILDAREKATSIFASFRRKVLYRVGLKLRGMRPVRLCQLSARRRDSQLVIWPKP
jgi:hypothetical protein